MGNFLIFIFSISSGKVASVCWATKLFREFLPRQVNQNINDDAENTPTDTCVAGNARPRD